MPDKFSVKEQVFNLWKEKLKTLSHIDSIEELLKKENEFCDLKELFTALKVIHPLENKTIENKKNNSKTSTKEEKTVNNSTETLHKNDNNPSPQTQNIKHNDLSVTEEKTDLLEDTKEDLILDTTKESILNDNQKTENDNQVSESEKQKHKLANIKGVSATGLFEEETLEEMIQEKEDDKAFSNKDNFKLDWNDKVEFSKVLFDNRQTELNETIQILNSFDSIQEAQQYLSDLYYEKNWDKVEEHAQRFWSLVENKFH